MSSSSMVGLDHLGIEVPADSFDKVLKTYLTILGPLGVEERYRVANSDKRTVVGIGLATKPFLWLTESKADAVDPRPAHIAITADTRAQVDEFHKLAMEQGLKCNGTPGLREHYHPNYYGAFVIDQMGNNLEVVKHLPEEAA
ncbi:hypothetical protein M407DRAFT_246132 [Tulasnella calospora MUT 4182]|uniref:Glyoxalase/fosfomycin resistance/dioxygenase domain-containing protein n=1 Tax=Tulasnella calospora MUT 4182 TaxID=1051891 RepID=A0A0C3Q6S3_9AGAM|nr:hypothetical protein M407DRAFT_246132 [Tulasnella calospora MUT 4182]